jgi:uncharacterized protein (DUF305 family)
VQLARKLSPLKESPLFNFLAYPRSILFSFAVVAVSITAAAQDIDRVKKVFEGANDRMMHGMMMELTEDADKNFAMMMIPHHRGAIDMAKLELQYVKDPHLRAMAEKIMAAQEAEIAELKKWQQDQGM